MTRLRLIPSFETPPDDGSGSGLGFRFTHPETGHKTQSRSKGEWLAKIVKYRKDNGLPVPDDMEAIAEDQLCQLLPSGLCRYEDGSAPKSFVDARIGIKEAIRGTEVFIHWKLNGGHHVSQEEAERRARICGSCYFNVQLSGCGKCHAFADYVYRSKGELKTKADGQLETRACAVCGCSSMAQVWVPTESLNAGTDDKTLAKYPSHCWKKISLIEHRAAQAV